ncbi:chaperone NapD [Parendozoicomonas haliclonae]|nr:chaperone NapD [Parendozoicomonas haliclonae]
MEAADKPLPQELSVTGLVVMATPGMVDTVKPQLEMIPGVEVHGASPEGKMVVTIEELPGQKIMVDTITQISLVDGVLSTALVYSHTEDWSDA